MVRFVVVDSTFALFPFLTFTFTFVLAVVFVLSFGVAFVLAFYRFVVVRRVLLSAMRAHVGASCWTEPFICVSLSSFVVISADLDAFLCLRAYRSGRAGMTGLVLHCLSFAVDGGWSSMVG
jgi:hypothetical protein